MKDQINHTNIGGEIEFDNNFVTRKVKNLKFLKNASFFTNGRSALNNILYDIKNLNVREIYVPLFCCDSIIKTVKKNEFKINFYGLTKELNPKIKPKKNSAIIVINYFGRESSFIKKYYKSKKKNYLLIEDATHNFLNKDFIFDTKEHYLFFSLRKHSFSNIGACSNLCRVKNTENKSLNKLFKTSQLIKIKKKLQLNSLEYFQNEKFFMNYFKKIENKISNIYSNLTIPKNITNQLLKTNWTKISKIRRNNWENLDLLIGKKYKKIFKSLMPFETPIGYIIFVKDRNKLRNYLKKKRIFTAVHWPLHEKSKLQKFKYETLLSKHLITIPIDQRYRKSDMAYIAKQIIESGIK